VGPNVLWATQSKFWVGHSPPSPHFSAPHVLVRGVIALHTLPVAPNQAFWILPSVPQNSSNHFRVIASYLWKVANFNPPQLHFASSLGVTPFEFCRELQHQKTGFPGLSCGIVCVTFSRLRRTLTCDRCRPGHNEKNFSEPNIFSISGHFSGHIVQRTYNQSKPNRNKYNNLLYILWKNSEIMTWNFLY